VRGTEYNTGCVKFTGAYGDIVNFENLPAQFSKMLISIGFVCVYQ
jgi:hypothetical protein